MRKYAIMCGSRSGSSHLSDLLKSTNRCGDPKEYFNPELKDSWMKKFGWNPSYVDRIINKTKTENDVFGVKVVGTREQLEAMENSQLQLTHWIWLRRADSILQAISRYRAFKTNIWHMKHPDHKKPLEYAGYGIKWCIDEIKEEEKFYHKYFENKNFLEIWYEEDLLDFPEQVVVAILSYLNISTDDLPKLKSSQIIARDETTLEWKHRFERELKNGKI